jgi:hypothetical protein
LWFPLAREINGAKLETLSVPIITHHIHPLNWNQYAWLLGGHRFWKAFKRCRRTGDPDRRLVLFEEISGEWWEKERPGRLI